MLFRLTIQFPRPPDDPQNLALNVAEKGFKISVYNRSGDKTDNAVARAQKEGLGENLVGQNLGAGKPDRAAKSGWQATKIGLAMSIPTAAIMYFFAAQIAGAMSHDAKVIACTADYFR